MKRATKLTCNQVRFYSETFTAEQLDANLAAAVQRHLSECTDCRVQHHRTRRVVALLQLKRHEQPPPGYFENFLTEFHQRLAASQPTGWRAAWARFTEPTALSPAWKWAASGAC
ncbi:MAG: hypothetical protein RMM51_12125, partial [Verrucomicrobiae bacterium]|nr:hypothetical protein [Verrucomicrobiae bacterium]